MAKPTDAITARVPYGPPIENALRQGDVKTLSELLTTVHGAVAALANAKPETLRGLQGTLGQSEYAAVLKALETIRGAVAGKK